VQEGCSDELEKMAPQAGLDLLILEEDSVICEYRQRKRKEKISQMQSEKLQVEHPHRSEKTPQATPDQLILKENPAICK
jgi:hypothetical protein